MFQNWSTKFNSWIDRVDYQPTPTETACICILVVCLFVFLIFLAGFLAMSIAKILSAKYGVIILVSSLVAIPSIVLLISFLKHDTK